MGSIGEHGNTSGLKKLVYDLHKMANMTAQQLGRSTLDTCTRQLVAASVSHELEKARLPHAQGS